MYINIITIFDSYLLDITVAQQESIERQNKPLQTLIDDMLILKRQKDKKDSGKTIGTFLHNISYKFRLFYNLFTAWKLNRDISYCFFRIN